MEGSNIAATYSLVYRFLKQQSQSKAADAVKKAAKAVVVIRDDIDPKGPALEDIIKEWKAKENTKSDGDSESESSSEESESSDDSDSSSKPKDGSGSDSSSEDDSDSESEDDDTSDSDDSNDKSEEETQSSPKKTVERDTSVTLSSAGENTREPAKKDVQIPEQSSTKSVDKLAKDKNDSKSDSSSLGSSDSDDSNEDSSSEGSTSDSSDAESSSDSSEDSSSSDSSEENKANQTNNAAKTKTKTTESESESSSGSELERQEKEDAPVAKKRKTSGTGVAVTTAVVVESQQTARASQKNERQPPTVKERFQRVKVQNLTAGLLLNNEYEAKGGVTNDYGERAHRDLIVTRGAGFRKEKNKKKRGSYRGGEITMENHSIKFAF